MFVNKKLNLFWLWLCRLDHSLKSIVLCVISYMPNGYSLFVIVVLLQNVLHGNMLSCGVFGHLRLFTMDSMWNVYIYIVKFWLILFYEKGANPTKLGFISLRVDFPPSYNKMCPYTPNDTRFWMNLLVLVHRD